MSRVLRGTQDGLVPGPCLLLSRWLSWAPDLGCVTFHESYTLQQKRLLKDPPVMPQVSDQQLSIPAPYPGASSRGSLESRVTPATKCLANILPQSQRQVQGFHKVNTSPCHSALTAVCRSLSLDVRRPGTVSNTHNLRAKEHFTVGQVSHARTNHGLFLACRPLCLLMLSPAPGLPPSPPGHCSNIKNLDQNREGKTLTSFLATHFSQPPRLCRAKMNGNTINL